MYRQFGKRILDLCGASVGLILLLPICVVIAPIIYWNLGSPILFKQRRPGLHGLPFTLIKFRTMRNVDSDAGNPLPDSGRLTVVGRFLRSLSLDELPTLINVLKGDMSLVGPRPLLIEYLARYDQEQMRRHEVRPGITGWAQTQGRNAITWEDKFRHDVWYVSNLSFFLDMKILLLTPWKILKREGITEPGQATASEFKGSRL